MSSYICSIFPDCYNFQVFSYFLKTELKKLFEKETNTTKIRKKLLLYQEDKTETRKFQGNQLVINEIEKLKKFFGGRRTRLTKERDLVILILKSKQASYHLFFFAEYVLMNCNI